MRRAGATRNAQAGVCVRRITHCQTNIQDCISGLMEQSPAQQLEDMQVTLVRAITLLENHEIMEAHRLLFLLRGMVEGAPAEAQHGRWRR